MEKIQSMISTLLRSESSHVILWRTKEYNIAPIIYGLVTHIVVRNKFIYDI